MPFDHLVTISNIKFYNKSKITFLYALSSLPSILSSLTRKRLEQGKLGKREIVECAVGTFFTQLPPLKFPQFRVILSCRMEWAQEKKILKAFDKHNQSTNCTPLIFRPDNPFVVVVRRQIYILL